MNNKIKQDICIGSNICVLRQKAHLTQEQMVGKLKEQGVATSRSIYSQIECGSYSLRVSELMAFSEIFGVDYNTIFEKTR